MENEHREELHGLSAKQIYFNFTNKYALLKGYGKSVISGKPTKFNEITGRYERFRPEEKQAYREYFLKNMKKAGKEHLMKDMEHQKFMLSHRKISGKYRWSDGVEIVYTGSYEKKFLEYLDVLLGWPSSDIMGPAPQIFPYFDENGVEHAHIPDFYISSLNLIVNIKSSENQHYRLRDIETEKREDEAIRKSNFNYIKIYDNKFERFTKTIEEIKENTEKGIEKRIILESVEENLTESSIYSVLLEEEMQELNE
jgi:hypothetical protein